MVFALDPDDVIDYVLEEQKDKPVDEQVVFKLKRLTMRELAKVESLFEKFTGDKKLIQVIDNLEETLNLILKGWSNLKFNSGKECKFSDYKGRLLDVISMDIASSLLNGVIKVNTLTSENSGN